MISASHNPVADNGIKFFDRRGFKLDSAIEAEAERMFFAENDDLPRPTGRGVGRSFRSGEALQHYYSFLKDHAPELKGVKIAVDCAHGSLCEIALRLYKELGAEVFPLNSSPDGEKINVNAPSKPTSSNRLIVSLKSASLSVGKATIISVVKEISGRACRNFFIASK